VIFASFRELMVWRESLLQKLEARHIDKATFRARVRRAVKELNRKLAMRPAALNSVVVEPENEARP
jgi:hypothetical protein